MARSTFFQNMVGQDPWELRGTNEARIRALETKLDLISTGVWTSFTPTFSNVTVGNGPILGYYVRIGRLITYRGSLVIGSSTSITGFIYINLPVLARDTSHAGSCYINNDGHNSGVLAPNSTADVYPVVGNVHAGASTPATWSAGEYMTWTITYEAAT